MESGPLWGVRGLGGGAVGGHHHCALLPARGVPGDQAHLELCARGRGGRLRLGHGGMAPDRSKMVQGACVQPQPFPIFPGCEELLPLSFVLILY